jgi:subfamily B ATP-binding cassette protein HlyB/CyaB
MSASRDALAREFARTRGIEADDVVRLMRRQGLKARRLANTSGPLTGTHLPAYAGQLDGGAIIVAKIDGDKVLIHRGDGHRPELMSRSAFESLWDSSLLLIIKRASLSNLLTRFGISWFMAAIYKYRRIRGQVLLASFFLQVFGLISPLFIQVVVDKVLVHRGVSILNVLLVGLVAASILETILGALRTYVFSHTTNRIDVELEARPFHHLVAVRLGYFGARRAGDTVAQVRELENIRRGRDRGRDDHR